MSIKLSDTQLALLSAASQREDRHLTPETGPRLGPVKRAARKLLTEGLVQEVRAQKDAPVWRRDEDSDQAFALKLTAAGFKAIARGADEQQETAEQTSSSDAVESESMPGGIDARDAGARVESARPRVPRAGTKISNVIDMLGAGLRSHHRRNYRHNRVAAAYITRRAHGIAQARIRARLGSLRSDARDGLSDRVPRNGRGSHQRGGRCP
jgi:hypothetical protein